MPPPKTFISDEEMAALEQQEPPEFIPDEAPAQPAAVGVPGSPQAGFARILGLPPMLNESADPADQARARAAARTVAEVGVGAATAPFTGGLGLAARLGAAGAAGFGTSLAAEAVDPTEAPLRTAAGTAARFVAGEGIGSAAARIVQAAAPAVQRFAQTQGAKALGLIQSGFRKAGIGGARAMAQEALDTGVISPLASAETMLGRAGAVGDQAGQALGALRQTIDGLSPGDDVLPIAAQLQNALEDWQPGTSAEAAFRPHMERVIDDLLAFADPQTGKITAAALAKFKKMLADTVYTDPLLSAAQLTGALRPRTETARAIAQGAEDALAGRVLAPDDLAQFAAQKTRYGAMAKAREALEQRLARDVGNNQVFGLGSSLAGIGTAAATANPVAGLAALAGGRFLHQRGNQISASAANRLARLAASPNSPAAIRSAAQAIIASLEGQR